MKTRLILLVAVLLSASFLFAQKSKEYKPFVDFNRLDRDYTLNMMDYINYNFYDRKELYIGRTVGELTKEMETPVKTCGFFVHIIDQQKMVPGISLNFLSDYEISKEIDRLMNMPEGQTSRLVVYFVDPIPLEDVTYILRKYGEKWSSPEVVDFYGKRRIKDIITTKIEKKKTE